MRRPTAIALIVLAVLLGVTAVVQFTQPAPPRPYPGPMPGTPLPPELTRTPNP
ncbi:MAG: hypothetical protein KatS3mg013_1169 [Actinomycetota bacterium]|nr:MAG: hypothetical protein KatS3mg013_1169 [Actinomycetota bacterium]